MPLYDYHCDGCGETFDEFRSMNERKSCPCPVCGEKARKLPNITRLDYYNMGVQDGLPTALAKWEKMHRKEAKREYD